MFSPYLALCVSLVFWLMNSTFSFVLCFHPCRHSLVYKYSSCVPQSLRLDITLLLLSLCLFLCSCSRISTSHLVFHVLCMLHLRLQSTLDFDSFGPGSDSSLSLLHHLVSILDFFLSCLGLCSLSLHSCLILVQSWYWPMCNSWVVNLPAGLGLLFWPFGMLGLHSEVCSWHLARFLEHWGQTPIYPLGMCWVHGGFWNKIPSMDPPGPFRLLL